jgi:hypothetical protein
MRYQARWSNGLWKTFDRNTFTDVDVHRTRREAEANAVTMNMFRRR